MEKSLTIFRINNNFWTVFRDVIILIASVFISLLITYLISFTSLGIFNFLIFLTFLILIYYSVKRIFKPVFEDIGFFGVSKLGLRMEINNKFSEIFWHNIQNLEFHYSGDIYWRARRKKNQKRVGERRYSAFFKQVYNDLMFYDYVKVDATDYLVKIRNHEEKNKFMDIYKVCKQNYDRTNLTEIKTYREYLDN